MYKSQIDVLLLVKYFIQIMQYPDIGIHFVYYYYTHNSHTLTKP